VTTQAAFWQLCVLVGCVPEQPAELEQVTVRYCTPVVPQAPWQELHAPTDHVPSGVTHAAFWQLCVLAGRAPAQPAELGQDTERLWVPLVPQAPEQLPQLPVCQVPWTTATQEPLTSHGLKQLFPS